MFYKPGSLSEPGGLILHSWILHQEGPFFSFPPLLLQGMEDLLDGRLDCGSDDLSDASQVGDWIVAVLPLLVLSFTSLSQCPCNVDFRWRIVLFYFSYCFFYSKGCIILMSSGFSICDG